MHSFLEATLVKNGCGGDYFLVKHQNGDIEELALTGISPELKADLEQLPEISR